MRRSLLLIALLGAAMVPCLAATDGVPAGWFLAGTQPQNYNTGADGNGVAFLASKADATGAGFGTLMQSINAESYRGTRVRFSARVRSEDVTGWAGLWMRVDEGTLMMAFDNMHGRPIKGSTGWNTYEVVLDVPPGATTISYGTLLGSRGSVWIEHATVASVGTDVRTTGEPFGQLPKSWLNLGFRQQ
jgi:hypothetical protein